MSNETQTAKDTENYNSVVGRGVRARIYDRRVSVFCRKANFQYTSANRQSIIIFFPTTIL